MQPKIGVLVAYDTFMYREGLKAIIDANDIRIVAEAVVVQRVTSLAQQPEVHVVVMGVSWHYDDHAGINVITQLKQRYPEKWIVAIGENQGRADQAKMAGADIALTIRLSKEELLDGIRSRTASYKYDVFISYSHEDRDWVHTWLVPTLDAAGIRVCVDVRDFEPGASSIAEIERAAAQSRKTLLVLTPEYFASGTAEFEQILIQTSDPAARNRRIIPLVLKPCALPQRLAMLSCLHFADVRQDSVAIERLIAAVKPMQIPGGVQW
jgi:hypothetical protein